LSSTIQEASQKAASALRPIPHVPKYIHPQQQHKHYTR
jgi:hypothetical protein